MTRLGALVWFVLVLAAGFATFKVKYAVQDAEDQLTRARKQTIAERQEIRVLTAEWTYLNQPERLADLNQRFLGLVPITAKQLQQKIADIPWRVPPAAPDAVVAAAPAGAAPQAPQAAQVPQVPQAPLAVIPAALGPGPASAGLPVRLAKAEPAAMPKSLDALIAQIAEAR
jgi:cell division protein FtsL